MSRKNWVIAALLFLLLSSVNSRLARIEELLDIWQECEIDECEEGLWPIDAGAPARV